MAIPAPDLGSGDNASASRRSFGRMPVAGVAVCFVLGILTDRLFGPDWTIWLLTAGFSLAAAWACVAIARPRLAAGLLLLCCAALGGARHHALWSAAGDDDISLFATEERRPVRLTGVIASAPWISPRETGPLQAAWDQLDTTVCDVDCRSLYDGDRPVEVSGRIRLRVSGHMLHAGVGDAIEVRGWLARPRGPSNPGEFDYREYLRRQRVRCLVTAEHPDAVRRLGAESGWWFAREVGRIRAAVAHRFVVEMSGTTAPVASALLLEDRSRIDENLETAFSESGMMHVLAISGMHVAILALLCVGLCRLAGLSPLATTAVVLGAVAAQAVIAGARPPIMRAGVFILIYYTGRLWFRRAPVGNTLAAAALAVLLWDPTDLFDIGAQLSFLAVMGILWWQSSRAESKGATDQLERLAEGPLRRGLRSVGAWAGDSMRMMLGIWLFAAPLIAWQFHLLSPIGLILNVVLMPLVTLMLWFGYLSLLFALFVPWLAWPMTALFDGALAGFLATVERASRFGFGHLYVPGPPLWWLVGYYALLATTVVFASRFRRRTWRWSLLAAWCLLGLTVGLAPDRPPGLRCTFLAVGHGNAILIELPNGRTLLYDAGAIDDAQRAQRAVLHALWHRGLHRIDGIVVSHPDLDHFNGIPGLLKRVPVGTILCAPPFVSAEQKNAASVIEAASAAGVPIRLIGEGDRLRLDESVSIRVLHPRFDRRSEHDNADSIVLEVEYAGRRILLTGDVEADGLEALLQTPRRRSDVLLSPHHGSLQPNSPELAAWAQPAHVVVSGGRDQVLPVLRRVYGATTPLWNTSDHGAMTVAVRPDGHMDVKSFRDR